MTKTFPLLPNLTCPELAGYKLPSFPRSQEDKIDYAEFLHLKSRQIGNSFETGYKHGYRKAREKYEFSESHIEKAILFGAMQQHMFGHINRVEEDNFIQSLRTPRTPIAIEVEMWPSIPGKDDKEIPKLNPDGTVKGRWVYE